MSSKRSGACRPDSHSPPPQQRLTFVSAVFMCEPHHHWQSCVGAGLLAKMAVREADLLFPSACCISLPGKRPTRPVSTTASAPREPVPTRYMGELPTGPDNPSTGSFCGEGFIPLGCKAAPKQTTQSVWHTAESGFRAASRPSGDKSLATKKQSHGANGCLRPAICFK